MICGEHASNYLSTHRTHTAGSQPFTGSMGPAREAKKSTTYKMQNSPSTIRVATLHARHTHADRLRVGWKLTALMVPPPRGIDCKNLESTGLFTHRTSAGETDENNSAAHFLSSCYGLLQPISQRHLCAAAADVGAVTCGIVVHSGVLLAFHVIRPSSSRLPAGCTSLCAQMLWTTWQSNVLSLTYYLCGLASIQHRSSALEQLVANAYPFVFSLGVSLTGGYYLLHNLPALLATCRMRRKPCLFPGGGPASCSPRKELACHLEHMLTGPAAVYHAMTLRLAVAPTHVETAAPILAFAACSSIILASHRSATRLWHYPTYEAVHHRAGLRGVVAIRCFQLALGLLAAYVGKWVAREEPDLGLRASNYP